MEKDYPWADTASQFNEQLDELTQGDGCSFHATCNGDDECPFEDCLLASDDWREILGRYCWELTKDGLADKEIGKKINRCASSVWSYKKLTGGGIH